MSGKPPARKKQFVPKIVSANDLFEGKVVYLKDDGAWTHTLRQAAIASNADEAEALLALSEQPGQVVGPYLLDIQLRADGCPAPVHFRERFRELGPSNRPDLGRQADRKIHLCSDTSNQAV
ncbi:MAG: DUF2849 domain-containing protein [Pseudomonadota bacterium]